MREFVLQKYIKSNSKYYRIEERKNKEFNKIVEKKLKFIKNISTIFFDIFSGVIFLEKSQNEFGWKIHISTNINNSIEILELVSDYLINERVHFKYIDSFDSLIETSQKNYSRVQFGKFITIYPENKEEFLRLIEELYELLKKFKGHYILTDKRYKDCEVIYYRFGAHFPKLFKNSDGDDDYYIKDGNGNLCLDKRLPYFYLPDGIVDPFVENDYKNISSDFFNRYDFLSVIRYTNMGGVYRAKNKNNEVVVIKEAKPYTSKLSINDLNDSISFKENEFYFLNKLSQTGFVPKAIEKIKITDYLYVVEEYIDGVVLSDVFLENPIFSSNFNIEDFQSYLIKVSQILLDISKKVKVLHKLNIINGDLSDENIIINNNNNAFFIDWESAVDQNYSSCNISYQYKTIGFRNSKDLIVSSDVYSTFALLVKMTVHKIELLEVNKEIIIQHLTLLKHRFPILVEYTDFLFDTILSEKLNLNIDSLINFLEKYIFILNSATIIKNEKHFFDEKHFFEISHNLKKTIIKEIENWDLKENICTPYYNSEGLWFGNIGVEYYKRYFGLKYNLEHVSKLHSDSMNLQLNFIRGKLGLYFFYLENDIDLFIDIEEINDYIENTDIFDISNGLSGLGIYCLQVYKKTKNFSYRLASIKIFKKFIITPNNQLEKCGLGFGNSGIALFLVHFDIYNNKFIYDVAHRLIMYDLSMGIMDGDKYRGFPEERGNKILYPYYWVGTSGILFVYIQLYKKYREEIEFDSIEILNKLISSLSVIDTSNSGFFYGLSGIAYVIHEYATYVNQSYKNNLYSLLEMLCTHSFELDNNLYFLSDKLVRISLDIGSGLLGISLILNKILNNMEFNFLCFNKESEEI